MSLDLAFDDGQQAIADAVAHFCADHLDDDAVKQTTGTLPRAAWSGLAALGVLGVLRPDEEGGLLEAVAAVESLGRSVFPGPLAASFLATVVLDDPEAERVADGSCIVSAGASSLWPWAPEAELFLGIEDERVYRAQPPPEHEPVETLGGEPWGRCRMDRGPELSRGREGLVVYRTLLAAQLVGLGSRLVDDASEHAAVRRQFGRPIGDFQAVAHPLADCSMRLAAAGTLTHAAAFHFDDGASAPARLHAAAAHASAAAAALEAAHVCHQVFGAIGITLEGPAFHVSRRIRQLASLPPGPAASRTLVSELARSQEAEL